MKKNVLLVLCALILFTINCSEIRVNHDYDKEADFSKFKTFDFLSAPMNIRTDSIAMKRIYNTVALGLKDKGLTRVVDNADLLIAVHTDVRDQINVNYYGYSYSPYYWHGYWGPGAMGVYTYEQGSLVIDMVEAKDMEMVWRGVAQAALPSNPDPARMEEGIKVAVSRILDKYPPKK